MPRPKGSKNKKQINMPQTLTLSPEARISLLANLIVERIEADRMDGYELLKRIGDS
jgi:hypothetical protein